MYLHIGAPKTGTTAIQIGLARNRSWLLENGIVYPPSHNDQDVKGEINSGNGFLLSSALNPGHSWHQEGDYDRAIEALTAITEEHPEHSILYSSEHLFHFNRERLQRFVEDVTELGLRIQTIFWVRDVADHALSAYGQLLKRHRYTHSFLHYLKEDYSYRLAWTWNQFADFTSKDAISVANYSRHSGRVFSRFCEHLGLETSPEQESAETVNRGLSTAEVEIMRYMNQISDGEHSMTRFSDRMLSRGPTGAARDFITPEEYAILETGFGSMVEYFNKSVGQDVLALKSPAIEVRDAQTIELTDVEKTLIGLVGDQSLALQRLIDAFVSHRRDRRIKPPN